MAQMMKALHDMQQRAQAGPVENKALVVAPTKPPARKVRTPVSKPVKVKPAKAKAEKKVAKKKAKKRGR